jgi:hypothetical protein
MTTRTEKVRKLRALGRSPNKHEAALALQKARELEPKTAKGIAMDIASLLKEQGLKVRVSRYNPSRYRSREGPAFDVEIDYRTSQARIFRPRHQLEITIVEYEERPDASD